jgi:hypothetical protein
VLRETARFGTKAEMKSKGPVASLRRGDSIPPARYVYAEGETFPAGAVRPRPAARVAQAVFLRREKEDSKAFSVSRCRRMGRK